jgi:primosomal protein N' (replication factor Y)
MDETARHAAVAIPVPVRSLYTYAVGAELAAKLDRGARVHVPFGRRRVVGTVVEWPAAPPADGVEVRPIEGVVEGGPTLPEDVLALTRFVSDYYLCGWGEAIECAMPPAGVRSRPRLVVRANALAPTPTGRAPARERLLARLAAEGGALPVERLSSSERRAAREAARAGAVEIAPAPAREAETPRPRTQPGEAGPVPTPAQARALEALDPGLGRAGYRPFLLFGATGSGKTEVYLRAARTTLDRGRSVLWLVPEIGLTPLLRETIERRFPGEAVVLHSGLARAERHAAWERVRRDACRLVLGTRSAVFAPLVDLGLVIVDEEQDASYKQGESPRYHGRDVAVVRAREAQATIVLGSATPSVESFHHARSGRYELVRLGGRIEDRPLPAVEIVDMREEYRRLGQVSPLSSVLRSELEACLARGDQALVLRNRRGWAAALHCPACGERVECTRCTLALTWHRAIRRLRCHTCGAERPEPESGCPTCGHPELQPLGEGTERIEALLAEAVPGARIERMDRDTVRGRGDHERILGRFARGEIDVLVGTQMIAKGHDFPRVTLVGVVSADQALGLPDFRAAERAFGLLTQVAGRAGRGERPGRVIVQAFDAEHPILALAAAQDYEAFFDREMRYRRALGYPPAAALVSLVVHDPDEARARRWAELLARALREAGGGRIRISGPGPAPIARIAGRHRLQILARTAGRRRLVETVERALAQTEREVPRRSVIVDVDPLALL